jgi:hypothetical protein
MRSVLANAGLHGNEQIAAASTMLADGGGRDPPQQIGCMLDFVIRSLLCLPCRPIESTRDIGFRDMFEVGGSRQRIGLKP